MDGCPNDPAKTAPGVCGCAVPDTDTDSDGVVDCLDGCPDDPDKTDPGDCACGNSEDDEDGDSVTDCVDNCPSIPNSGQDDEDGNGVGDRCDGVLFIRGDANRDGSVSISDSIQILKHLFRSGQLSCVVAGDANDDDQVDISDTVRLLIVLFWDTDLVIPPPFPIPGLDDRTPGPLECDV